MLIKESNEILNVTPYPLSKTLTHYLKAFQQFISFIKFKPYTYDEVKELYDQIKGYKKYSFAKPIIQSVEKYIESIDYSGSYKPDLNWNEINTIKKNFVLSSDEFINLAINIDKVKQRLKSISIDKVRQLNSEISLVIHHRKNAKIDFTKLRAMSKGGADIFFSGGELSGLLRTIDQHLLDDIKNRHIEKSYTYLAPQLNMNGSLKLPESTHELEYIIYLIEHLKTSPKPVRLHAREYEVYKRWTDDRYSALRKLVKEYIRTNNKEYIEQFKEQITDDLARAISVAVRPFRQQKVYRGIGLSIEYDGKTRKEIIEYKKEVKKEIINREKEARYVSSSPRESDAERFARGISHLENEDMTRNKYGAILEYDISKPFSVIFYTTIFGTVYGEFDLVIDTRYAILNEENIRIVEFLD